MARLLNPPTTTPVPVIVFFRKARLEVNIQSPIQGRISEKDWPRLSLMTRLSGFMMTLWRIFYVAKGRQMARKTSIPIQFAASHGIVVLRLSDHAT